MEIVEVGPDSKAFILFSEALVSLIELAPRGLNLTYLNQNKHKILEVKYKSAESEFQLIKPNITDWNILEFNRYELILQLNFTNQLYISQ